MVYRDRHIKRVLELGRNANIAIFSVGTVRDTALFFRLGYADSQEKNYLKPTLSVTFVPASSTRTETFPARN